MVSHPLLLQEEEEEAEVEDEMVSHPLLLQEEKADDEMVVLEK